MRRSVVYSCVSHIGNVRHINQDNYICVNQYHLSADDNCHITGAVRIRRPVLFGVFDGLGGEQKGEVASLIAAKQAAGFHARYFVKKALARYCISSNQAICRYAEKHKLSSMGTTAAMVAFTKKEIVLCNIGDSKIFQFSDNQLKQISQDHVSFSVYGKKAPLFQNLGIPPEESRIEPYITAIPYQDQASYLICTDGLTDMLQTDEIAQILSETAVYECGDALLQAALQRGGRDNITILVCKTSGENVETTEA